MRRGRHITSASSWRPVSAGNGYWANLPENLLISPCRGKMACKLMVGLLITGPLRGRRESMTTTDNTNYRRSPLRVGVAVAISLLIVIYTLLVVGGGVPNNQRIDAVHL